MSWQCSSSPLPSSRSCWPTGSRAIRARWPGAGSSARSGGSRHTTEHSFDKLRTQPAVSAFLECLSRVWRRARPFTTVAAVLDQRAAFFACLAAVGVIVALAAKEPTAGTSTVRAHKSRRVEMALQPDEAQAIIKEVGNRKVDHTLLLQARV